MHSALNVIRNLKKSRQEAFELTAQTAADYLEKQYQLSQIGDLSGATLQMATIPTTATALRSDDFKRAGLKPENYILGANISTWYINTSTGRACVKLTAKTGTGNTGGEYYDVNPSVAQSTGC